MAYANAMSESRGLTRCYGQSHLGTECISQGGPTEPDGAIDYPPMRSGNAQLEPQHTMGTRSGREFCRPGFWATGLEVQIPDARQQHGAPYDRFACRTRKDKQPSMKTTVWSLTKSVNFYPILGDSTICRATSLRWS